MKTLQTLIKINKNILDKILVDIKKSEEEKSLLLKRSRELDEQVANEINTYHGSEYSLMLERYLDNAQKKQARIKAQIDRVENYLEKRGKELHEQFSELKKYEIALQTKQKLEYLKAQKEETKFLDEFGVNKYVYNKD